ncbi:MAG: cytochrome c oxidase subunit II [Ilyomonas sp.]
MIKASLHNFSELLFQSMTKPSSAEAHHIYGLFKQYSYAALGMLLLVSALTAYACYKFRKKKDDERKPAQFKGNAKVEALMIGGPFLLLIWFFYQTVKTMKDVEPGVDKNRQPDVVVTAHQFWWEVQYPDKNVTTANEVHLPANEKVLIELRSADVIHDWWVPELGNKMDMVPGRSNYLWLKIDKPAVYHGLCSEFCGAQHAWMRLKVIAQDENNYQNWLTAQAQPAVQTLDSTALKGAAIFQSTTCASCHAVKGTSAQGQVGPDLTHVFSRSTLLAGKLSTDQANLFKWISNPQKIKPGSKMPDFYFGKDTVNAIVHYLTQLK